MSQKKKKDNNRMVQQSTLVIVAGICLFVGFILGLALGIREGGKPLPQPAGLSQNAAQTDSSAKMEGELKALKQIISQNPSDASAWSKLGHFYFDSQQHAEAITAYEKSLELDENNPGVWTDLGVMYRRSGNPQKAIECFDRAFAVDSERARVVLDERRMRASAFFAETSERWDAMRVELFGSATGLAPLLGLVDPAWVVGDLGAGTGALAARLAPFAGTVIGVDRSAEMLSAARARLAEFENVELRLGDLEALQGVRKFPVRIKCADLPWTTLAEALDNSEG